MSDALADFKAWEANGGWGALARPMPMFVSQRDFRTAICYCEDLGWPDEVAFGAHQVIVHPDSLRWYQERLALRRMAAHFDALTGDAE